MYLGLNFSQLSSLPQDLLSFYPRKVEGKLALLTYSKLLLIYSRYMRRESAPLELLLIYNR